MRRVSEGERRALLVRRHRLDGSAANAREVVGALVALHATDPASVVLSVLARSRTSSIADVTDAFTPRRELVRWMAMRRTVFAFAREDVPLVQAAVGAALADALRRRLISRIERNGVDPSLGGDLPAALTAIEDRVEAVSRREGPMTGAQLRREVPALGAVIRPRLRSEVPQALTSPLLTVMSTAGRLVRGTPTGAWTSRTHRWEPVDVLWPDGLPRLDPAAARAELARRWLERFGPATAEDLEWWTGWNRTDTRAALALLDPEEVDLHGRPGIDLRRGEPEDPAGPEHVAALLPALDPTPMGWKDRGWFTAADPALLYDRAGNIGPTVWVDGELIGSWAVTPSGVRTAIRADRGRQAAAAVEEAAADVERRLEGVVVTPAARTPAERELAG